MADDPFVFVKDRRPNPTQKGAELWTVDCPYCNGEHTHGVVPPIEGQQRRRAECLGGGYVLIDDWAGVHQEAEGFTLCPHGNKTNSWRRCAHCDRDAAADDDPEGHDYRFDDLYVSRADLANLPRGEPLIDGVIDRNTVFVVAGRDQTFKSFLVLDWLCCLATGKPWMGREVHQCRVLYVIGEGAYGLDARINAWETAWNEKVEWLAVRRAPVNLFKQSAGYLDLLARIEVDKYEVVVFDTLQRNAAGADQNSARDAGTIIEALDAVRRATGGAAGIVAHTDKGDNDTRGSSAFEDDADIVWRTKRDEDEQTITLRLAKRKDGPDGTTIDLRPKSVEGTGSLVLSSAKSYMPHPDRPPTQAYPILRLLDGEAIPDQGLGATAIMQALKVSSRDQIYRALNWLMSEAYVQKVKVGQWPTFKIEPKGTVLIAEIAPDQH